MTATIERDKIVDQPVPEFTGKAAEALKEYYTSLDVQDKGIGEKIAALEANIGRFEFSAYGGDETEVMKLRAAERIFLFQRGIVIQ
jgi:hypothetical protein